MTHQPSKMHRRVMLGKEGRAEEDRRVAEAAFEAEKEKAKAILNDSGVIPANLYWDDASRVCIEVQQSIVQAHELVANRVQRAMSTPERRAKIKDEAEAAQCINIITRDITQLLARLDLIAEKHKQYSGMATTPEQVFEVMEIQAQYAQAVSLFHDNVMPVVTNLFDLLGDSPQEAEQMLQQQAELADRRESLVVDKSATDPNVVTDVEVKEIKPSDKL
jgi:hypothetical protein